MDPTLIVHQNPEHRPSDVAFAISRTAFAALIVSYLLKQGIYSGEIPLPQQAGDQIGNVITDSVTPLLTITSVSALVGIATRLLGK